MIDLTREKLISLADVARMCGVSLTTVYAWRNRRDRRLETAKVGGKRITTVEALNRFKLDDEEPELAASTVPHRPVKSEAERQLRELQDLQ